MRKDYVIMCKVDTNEQNKKFEETNRDFLAPFLNQKITCSSIIIILKIINLLKIYILNVELMFIILIH